MEQAEKDILKVRQILRRALRSKRLTLLIALGLAAFAFVLSSVPNWYHYLRTPTGMTFGWGVDAEDNNTYLAKMRVGYRGDWMYTNPFSPQPHPPVFMFPFHILLGRVAAACRDLTTLATHEVPAAYIVIPSVYEGSRLLLSVMLLGTIYWFTGIITRNRWRRLWLFAITLFCSGSTGGYILTEGNILKTFAQYPHFIIALIFYLWVCGAFITAMKTPSKWKSAALWAAVAGFGLGWIHPFDAIPLFTYGGVALLWRWQQVRRFPRELFLVLMAFSWPAGGPILYQMIIRWTIPLFAAIDSQNVCTWPRWWELFRQMDTFLPLGFLGLIPLWRMRRRPEAMFVFIWVPLGVAITYLPVIYQRRMIEGLPVALAVSVMFLADGLVFRLMAARRKSVRFSERVPLKKLRRLSRVLVLLVLLPKTFWIMCDYTVSYVPISGQAIYTRNADLAAMTWLEENTEWTQVIWADPWTGNQIPFVAGNRVVYGHWVESVNSRVQWDRSIRLFVGRMSEQEMLSEIDRMGVDYIYWLNDLRRAPSTRRGVHRMFKKNFGEPAYHSGFVFIFDCGRSSER